MIAPLFEVNLEQFEGPIDLLLHLVKKNELPITEVSLALISNQYLSCIERLAAADFELAGEYLVIAATLLAIKSSVLLKSPDESSDLSDPDGPDPTAELLRRLQEAERFREVCDQLERFPLLGIDVFPVAVTVPDNLAVAEDQVPLKQHTVMMLARVVDKLLKKKRGGLSTFTIELDAVSITDRMIKVVDVLKLRQQSGISPKISLEELFEENLSVANIVGLFCALLELCKRLIIRIEQTELFGEIKVVLADTEISAAEVGVSEFDIAQETLVEEEQLDLVVG